MKAALLGVCLLTPLVSPAEPTTPYLDHNQISFSAPFHGTSSLPRWLFLNLCRQAREDGDGGVSPDHSFPQETVAIKTVFATPAFGVRPSFGFNCKLDGPHKYVRQATCHLVADRGFDEGTYEVSYEGARRIEDITYDLTRLTGPAIAAELSEIIRRYDPDGIVTFEGSFRDSVTSVEFRCLSGLDCVVRGHKVSGP